MHFFARDSKSFVKLLFSTHIGGKNSFQKEFYFMSGFDAKRIFQQEMVKILKNAVFNPHWRKTVYKKELYCMTVCDAKLIFQREIVKMLKNALFNTQWSKTQFSRKSYIA